MNPIVAYMDHPIGETNGYDMIQRADNMANAVAWFKFLNDATQWTIHSPWYLDTIAIGGDDYGPRRVVSRIALLERSDVYIVTGGYLSPHMNDAIRKAKRAGVPILDLTAMGVTPPDLTEDLAQTIIMQARRAIGLRPRRVWVPLLTPLDLQNLQRARHELYTHVLDPHEHEDAVALIDRIIAAGAQTL